MFPLDTVTGIDWMMGEFNNMETWFPGYMCLHVHKPCGHMAMLKVIGNMATMKQDAVSTPLSKL